MCACVHTYIATTANDCIRRLSTTSLSSSQFLQCMCACVHIIMSVCICIVFIHYAFYSASQSMSLSRALQTTIMALRRSLHAEALQATASEGLAQSTYTRALVERYQLYQCASTPKDAFV